MSTPAQPGKQPADGGIVQAIVAGGVTAVVGSALHAAGALPESALVRVWGGLITWLSILYIARFATHWELKYWRWGARGEQAMCVLMALEAAIATSFLAGGLWLVFFSRGSDPRLLGTREFNIAAGIFTAVLVHSLVMSWLVNRLGYDRGSEKAEHCRVVKILTWVARTLSLGWVVDRLKRNTSVGSVSSLILAILALLAAVAAVNVPLRFAKTRSEQGSSGKGGQQAGSPEAIGAGPSPSKTVYAPPILEVPKPLSSPLYASLCNRPGSESEFGALVPQAQREELYAQWFAKTFGLGGIYAGCFHPAHQVGETGVWVAAGTCAGAPRSLAVATPEGPGAIVLFAAAAFAQKEAEAHRLLKATSHDYEHSGDMYTVTTTAGTTVFIHDELRGGGRSQTDPLQSCTEAGEGPVPFLEIPSGATLLWEQEMNAEEQWLSPTVQRTKSGSLVYVFSSEDPIGGDRVSVTCREPTECMMRARGASRSTSGDAGIDVGQLLEWAEARPASESASQQ